MSEPTAGDPAQRADVIAEPGQPGVDAVPVEVPESATGTAGFEDDSAPRRDADLVERADAELSSLDELPLAAHAEVYARIHETLNRELADIDGA